MKKVINGKMYNTETATKMGEWSNNERYGDLRHVEETLYRTKNGTYFVHGSGGPMTQYSVSCGNNSWSGGSRITPLTESEAKEWAEDKLSGDEYAEIFGEPDEA